MSISDWINVVLCVLSFILAVISVVTVVITLKQNSKMIKNSTRPYLVVTCQITNFQDPAFYLVLKNYGNSGATITCFNPSINLLDYSYSEKHTPFSKIEGTFIAPNQTITCNLNPRKMSGEVNSFTVEIKYTDGVNSYSEKCPINFEAYTQNVQARASTKDKELKIISYTLQDLVEKQF